MAADVTRTSGVPPTEVVAATLAQASGIARVYGAATLHTYATFDLEPASTQHFADVVAAADAGRGHHVLVAVRAGEVVGYAKSGAFRTRPGYARTVETSVYVDDSAWGQGVGTALYGELIALLDAGPAHLAVAAVAQPNDASVRLHERHGFSYVGTFHEIGHKFGVWRDVAWYERPLDPDGAG